MRHCRPSTVTELFHREFQVIVTIMDARDVFSVRGVDRADAETYRLRECSAQPELWWGGNFRIQKLQLAGMWQKRRSTCHEASEHRTH
jgi:hypothetical protein